MVTNLPIPADKEIHAQADQMFGANEQLKQSFVEAVWNTVWRLKTKKK